MSGACIELHVLSYAGAGVAIPALPLGATPSSIGRSPGCHLSLDDPERLISRSHLQAWLDPVRGAVLRNSSSGSPAFVEGEELPPGQMVSIGVGQRIMLGRYVLAVREAAAATAAEAGSIPVVGEASLVGAAGLPELPSSIPENFDVFAAPVAASIEADAVPPELAQLLGQPLRNEDLFEGVRPFDARGPEGSPMSLDPLALAREGSVVADILDCLHSPREQGSVADAAAGELDAVFALPRGDAANTGLLADLGEPACDLAPDASPPVAISMRATIDQAELSSLAVDPSPRAPVVAAEAAATPPDRARVVQGAAPLAQAAASPLSGAGVEALSAAFARGCGVPPDRLELLTEAGMEDLGRTFAALVSGALQLIHARSSTKHELRANVTIIASSGNNPLKFAPDAQAALLQLLGRGLPGFMAAEQAVTDAFDDLRAHQVGLLSASRAALYAMGQRLSPESIQSTAGGPRGFSGLLPSAHKARLWDHFVASHGALLGEAREEFDAVFQQAFVQAYEGEVERLQGGARA